MFNIIFHKCKRSKYWEHDYEIHTNVVEKLSLYLAEKFKADKQIVQLASLLHDIGRIKYGPKDHEKTGAEEAEKILKELGFSIETIEKSRNVFFLIDIQIQAFLNRWKQKYWKSLTHAHISRKLSTSLQLE